MEPEARQPDGVRPKTARLLTYTARGEAEYPLRDASRAPEPGGTRGGPETPVPSGRELRAGSLLLACGLAAAAGAFVLHSFLGGFLFSLALSVMGLGAWLVLMAWDDGGR